MPSASHLSAGPPPGHAVFDAMAAFDMDAYRRAIAPSALGRHPPMGLHLGFFASAPGAFHQGVAQHMASYQPATAIQQQGHVDHGDDDDDELLDVGGPEDYRAHDGAHHDEVEDEPMEQMEVDEPEVSS